MAGVGFELNKLFAKNSKVSKLGACFWSSLSCCGSMILSFILLFCINFILTKYNIDTINNNVFTTYITNIVLFSMLIYSFFSQIIARYTSDLIYENNLEKILPSFYGMIFIILIFSNIIFIPLMIISKITFFWILLLSILFSTLLCTWVVVSYVTILKYYKQICMGFIYGFFVSISIIISFFLLNKLSYEILFLSFIVGYSVTFLKLYLLLNKHLKSQDNSTFEILKYFSKYKNLAFSGFFITAGTLLPFYIFWFSDIGVEISLLFRSAPFYDLPAIIAYLTTIPTTIYFVAFLEPNFYPSYKKYFELLNKNGSYDQIKKAKNKMITILKHQLRQLTMFQTIITILSTVFLSKIIYLVNIGMSQSMLGVFRLLCIGYCLFSIGNSLVLVITYFSDYRSIFKVSGIFLLITAVISYISTYLPYYYYGVGIVVGSLVMCLLAIRYLNKLLDNLEYFILSKNSLYVKKEKHKFYDIIIKGINMIKRIFNFKVRLGLYFVCFTAFIVYIFNSDIFSNNSFIPNNGVIHGNNNLTDGDGSTKLDDVNIGDKIESDKENTDGNESDNLDKDIIKFNNIILTSSVSDKVLNNPGVGFAPWAKSSSTINMNTKLVYVDMSWREIEPFKGKFEFEKFESKNHLNTYKNQGRNVVFRLYLDYPSNEKEMNIPDWLYNEIEEDGVWYDNDYGKGFSPNYSNQVLIDNYKRLVNEIGNRYGRDNFFLYIELGGIGHWGEWHVDYDYGIDRLPKYDIRKNYVEPFINNFKHSYFLMRYPVIEAEKYGTGLYNDMIGHEESTNYWFKMMEGGRWSQTLEYELTNMMDAWKKYPIGGEFTSSLTDDFMLNDNLKSTLEQLKKSHQSFIGPKVIKDMSLYKNYENSLNEILKILGHRLYVSSMNLKTDNDNIVDVSLTINNDGIAPIYTNVNVMLHIYDENNEIYTKNINEYVDIYSVIDSRTFNYKMNNIFVKNKKYKVGISLDSPVTNKPIIELAMNNNISDKIYLIGEFTWK